MSSVYIRGDTVITGIEIWAGFFFFFFVIAEEVGENQLPPQKFSCLQILWNNIKISVALKLVISSLSLVETLIYLYFLALKYNKSINYFMSVFSFNT